GDRGLNVFNPKSVDFVHLRHEPNDPESLAPGAVYALFIDRSGSLWIGTQENLDDSHLTQIDARTGRATRHRSHPSNPSSLHPGSVQAIAEDAAGYLWIGHSQGAGISQLQAATGRVRRLTYE